MVQQSASTKLQFYLWNEGVQNNHSESGAIDVCCFADEHSEYAHLSDALGEIYDLIVPWCLSRRLDDVSLPLQI